MFPQLVGSIAKDSQRAVFHHHSCPFGLDCAQQLSGALRLVHLRALVRVLGALVVGLDSRLLGLDSLQLFLADQGQLARDPERDGDDGTVGGKVAGFIHMLAYAVFWLVAIGDEMVAADTGAFVDEVTHGAGGGLSTARPVPILVPHSGREAPCYR